MRLARVCRRPAVSIRTTSRPRALADEIASKTTAAGSDPGRARTKSAPTRCAHTSSCSVAAARKVSAAQITGCSPASVRVRANRPTVVVLPVPFTPTTITTRGGPPGTGARVVVSSSRRSSVLTTARKSDTSGRSRTASSSCMVADTPMSASIRISSRVSRVSTDTTAGAAPAPPAESSARLSRRPTS